jgi:C4-dicarboxylate-specific signal transduction histidine kinase
LEVADQGCGVSAERLERMFDPFHAFKTEGLGMGLAISHAMISALAGRLEARLNPRGGMTFIIELPV